MRPTALWTLAAMVLLIGCQREISGTYIEKFPNGLYWLQLVRTPDNRLTGQLETFVMGADGKIERNAVSVAGAVNAGNVTISASLLGLQAVTLSGTLDGNKLTLTGVQPGPIVLIRSDLGDYQRQVNALNAQSQHIRAVNDADSARQRTEQAQQNFISSIDRVVAGMNTFDSEAAKQLSSFPGVEQRYRAITARIAELVRRERQLAENPNAAVERGQLSVAASQTSIDTDQLHNSVLSLQMSLRTALEPLVAETTEAEQECRAAVPPGDLTPAQTDARSAACRRLFLADPPFRQKVKSVSASLVHLEETYSQERKTQAGLLQSAQRLQ